MLAPDLTITTTSHGQVKFESQKVTPNGTLRLMAGSTLAEPTTLDIQNTTVGGGKAGQVVVDKHYVGLLPTKLDVAGKTHTLPINLTIQNDRSGIFGVADVAGYVEILRELLASPGFVEALCKNMS